MRAAKKFRSQKSEVGSKDLKHSAIHISGAEGIYDEKEIQKIIRQYAERALKHPRGRPDEIVITVEKIKRKPIKIRSLPVATLNCNSTAEAKKIITDILKSISISESAIKTAFSILSGRQTMRGASLVFSESGRRAEPDKERGVRVSRLGIKRKAEKSLALKLSKHGINNQTVREAVILASKVASYKDLIAELCISDDPDYTIGYVSSREFGYIRIPNIKKTGEKKGGRVFFIKEKADINSATEFLEKIPVIINKVF
jgi:6-carboxyhexanoate--CoA ligase